MNPQADWVSLFGRQVTEFLRSRDALIRLVAHAVETGWIAVNPQTGAASSAMAEGAYAGENGYLSASEVDSAVSVLLAWNEGLSSAELGALRACAAGIPV